MSRTRHRGALRWRGHIAMTSGPARVGDEHEEQSENRCQAAVRHDAAMVSRNLTSVMLFCFRNQRKRVYGHARRRRD